MENTFGINIIPENDIERTAALRRYKILDTPPENAFDNVARLAARIFNVPISLVSLVDHQEVYFKANIGMGNATKSSRGVSLCSLAVLQPAVTVFENAATESCLLANPNVAGSFGLRFYAGAPLTTHDGFMIGTLCVIDKSPRVFSDQDREVLQGLATIVMDEIELRLSAIQEADKQLQTQENLKFTIGALSKSEARARYMIADAPVAIGVLHGYDLVVESANQMLLDLWGKTEAVINQPLGEALPELAGQPFFDILHDVLKSQKPFYGNEVRAMLVRNGVLEDVYFNFVYHPLKNLDGEATSVMVVATEVTDQVLARIKTHNAEERLRLAVDAANLGLWFIDPETKALEYNERLADIYGFEGPGRMTYDQAIGQVAPDFKAIIIYEINEAIKNKTDYDITFAQQRFNDRKMIWLRSIGKITQDDKGYFSIFSGVVMDVTEQVRHKSEVEELNSQLEAAYEEEVASNEELIVTNEKLNRTQQELISVNGQLRESEELKDIAIAQAKLGIWYVDTTTGAFVPSARLKEVFGFEPEEQMPYDVVISQIRADYRKHVALEVENAISAGTPYDLEYPIIDKKSGKLRWVRATGKLTSAQENKDAYFSGTIMDITEQKEDDQRKNDFITMVSHELKTPLTSINGYIQMLSSRARKGEDSFAISVLDKANKQTKKMITMINGFLNMKRLESGKIAIDKVKFDMAELIVETEEETVATISSHQVIFAPVETTIVEADVDKIGQVINNLISNAVKYSPRGSVINVACVTIDQTAMVSVKDRGMGISKADQEKLFSRFYRVENKEMESINGFGIGLYLCDEIIKRHSGRIWVESEPGQGSTFYFTLPLAGPE